MPALCGERLNGRVASQESMALHPRSHNHKSLRRLWARKTAVGRLRVPRGAKDCRGKLQSKDGASCPR